MQGKKVQKRAHVQNLTLSVRFWPNHGLELSFPELPRLLILQVKFRIINLNRLLFDSKKFVVRFQFYWRPPEGFHFYWSGLKSHFFQFETLRMVFYNPLEGFRYLSRGYIIPMKRKTKRKPAPYISINIFFLFILQLGLPTKDETVKTTWG